MHTEIHLLNIKSRLNDPVDKYLKYFSPERQNDILRYKFSSDRNRTLCAELFAKKLISDFTGEKFDDVKILRAPTGKPYCEIPDVYFSLSHSGDWIACSIGDVINGVDIENENRNMNLDVAKRFFLPNEYSTLKNLYYSGINWKRKFFCYWTLKESYLKCMDINSWSDVDCEKLLSGNEEISGCNFLVDDEYILGCCTSKESLPSEPGKDFLNI